LDEYGPVQILVVGFEGTSFRGEILPELARLRDRKLIRLLDLVVVAKGLDGEIVQVETTDLGPAQAEGFGTVARALLGIPGDEVSAPGGDEPIPTGSLLDDEAMWSVPDTIPTGVTAAVALIEHLWAVPLRDAIRRAGGIPLADRWIDPDDLVDLSKFAADV
jgi:Family of unknown function (DUF6325)